MHVDLVPASRDDEPRLGRLVQLYAYDFSEFMGMDVGEDARFDVGHVLTRAWTEASRRVYLIRVAGTLAGFVMLDAQSRLTGDTEVMDVAEFFVMRRYRRHGVGRACARRAFDLFPRRWEVREQANNAPAIAFWRATIADYTGGRFQEAFVDDERWRGPVQSFDARDRR